MRHFSLKNISIYQKPVFADSFAPLSPTAVSLLRNTPSNNPTASQGQFRIHFHPCHVGGGNYTALQPALLMI